MKLYFFRIRKCQVATFAGIVNSVPNDFVYLETSFGLELLYCRAEGDLILEIICEALTQNDAEKAVNAFLVLT